MERKQAILGSFAKQQTQFAAEMHADSDEGEEDDQAEANAAPTCVMCREHGKCVHARVCACMRVCLYV